MVAEVEKKIASMIAVIEDGGYVRGMVDRHRKREDRHPLAGDVGLGGCGGGCGI